MTKFLFTNLIFIALASLQAFFFDRWFCQLTIPITVGAYIAIISIGVTNMRFQFFCKSLCHGSRDKRTVALTFDDGPDLETTPVLIELLARDNIKATFFVVGEKAKKNPALIAKLVQAGHQVANHSYSHPWYANFLFGKALEKQILQTKIALEKMIGSECFFFRPPMGLTNPHYRSILKKNNITMVGWNIRTYDKYRDKHKIAEKISKKIRNGSIIMMHDSGESIEKLDYIIPAIYEKLKAQGYSFTTIQEMQ
jgi:peptidoglycan/xylan/chitin deacetylase (PgdA/CDA1 family)